MQNELIDMSNGEFGNVRGIDINGEAWLVGKDIVERLGYNTSTNSYSFYINKFVDDEDKLNCDSQSSFDYKQLGQRGGLLINESGLYSLVLRSTLPSAKMFKRWVTKEVLPSIRKHGVYMTPDVLEKTISDPSFMIGLLTNLKEEQDARRLAESKLEAAKPKIEFAEAIESTDKVISMGDMAKLCAKNGIKIGRNRLFEFLRDMKILNSNNVPYQRYMEWFEVTESVKFGKLCVTSLVTPKGQIGIVNIVKKKY